MLGSVESPSQDEADVLTATAKRHRVDVAKVRTSVETEFAAKQAKTAEKQKKAAPTKPAKPVKAQHKHCVSQKASGICRTPFLFPQAPSRAKWSIEKESIFTRWSADKLIPDMRS